MEWPIEVPLAEMESLFSDRAGRISHDATSLAGDDPIPEDAAVFSVLQFGAIVPPLSPWQDVSRLMPGYHYEGPDASYPVPLEPPPDAMAATDLEARADLVERTLDAILTSIVGDGPHPVLLFSGGVDSGLIAARLAALGYDDTLLLNYCYGPDDPESAFAEEMAAHIGLRFERLHAGLEDPCACLREPGRIWPQPFSDPSTMEVWDLAQSLVDRFAGTARPVLDGTGSLMDKPVVDWQRLLSIPHAMRKTVASAYPIGFWRRPESMDRPIRGIWRSVMMPLPAATLGENALAGTLYDDEHMQRVADMFTEWLEGWAGTTLPCLMAAGGFAFKCGVQFGARVPALLTPADITIYSPLMATEWIAMALVAAETWRSEEGKAPLKLALARHAPNAMVYRPKDDFADPESRVFLDPTFIGYLKTSIEPDGPIAHMLKPGQVARACDLLEKDRLLSRPLLRLLWGIVFCDRWYRTAV